MNSRLTQALLAIVIGALTAGQSTAQNFTTLHSFSSADDGSNPYANLILSSNTLYGTTTTGGSSGNGTVFKVNMDGTGYTNLYSFTGGSDGAYPTADLVLSGNTLYGVSTRQGIDAGNGLNGSIYKINTDGTGFLTLHTFQGTARGEFPYGGLALSGNALFGTTYRGGNLNDGTLFTVNTDGTGFTTLYVFTGGTNGSAPYGGVTISGTTLYGTTLDGGAAAYGTVFAVNTNGNGFTILHSFAGGKFGAYPYANLILSGNTLFGTTAGGEISDFGTVFAINTDGTGFVNICTNFTATNGFPMGELILSGAELYGTVSDNGDSSIPGSGAVFAIGTNGSGFTNVYSFTAISGSSGTNIDGAQPSAGLVLSSNTLYGVAEYGGNLGTGTVFAVNTNGTGFTALHTFGAQGINGDGIAPAGGLIASGTTFFGMANKGGASGLGTVFSLNTNGLGFTTLYNFNFLGGTNGYSPYGSLILSSNIMYGTAREGGTLRYGIVFALNTNLTGFTNVYSFTGGNDGAYPEAGLVLSGNTLYGTAYSGGAGDYGTVFAVNTDGTGFTKLHSFTDGIDGAYPEDGLILSGNTLYGTTYGGGVNQGGGSVFSVNTDGTAFTTIHAFTNLYNTNGAWPQAGVLLSGDTLYGTTSRGGAEGAGIIFAVNTNGTSFTKLHSFSSSTDGAFPGAGLTLSSNTLYGTAIDGGAFNAGTVFAVNTDGSGFATLYSFSTTDTNGFNSDGAEPEAGLILLGNTLYGTTTRGGTAGNGTVFSLPAAVPLGSLQVTIAPPGAASAGAQWQVDNGTLQSTGATVSNLPAGSHILSFTTISGWVSPVNETVSISANATATVTGTYVQQTGSLQVAISPAAAVSAGAQWQVDGGSFQTNGATVMNLLPGSHTLAFNTIAGWNSPASQQVTISYNQTTTASGTYIRQPTGSLAVTIAPAGAVAAGAEWQVDAGSFQTNGASVTNLSVGNHKLAFNTIFGWTTPSSQEISISSNQIATASGTYIQQFGRLQVTISPAAAVSAGAKWQVDGGKLQSSGATVSNLALGNHTIGFSTLSGWLTPSNQIAVLSQNTTATAIGTYIAIGSLKVTLLPAAAIAGGAQWAVDSGSWQNSGATLTNLSAGNHTLSFKGIDYWSAPATQTIAIKEKLTATAAGTYTFNAAGIYNGLFAQGDTNVTSSGMLSGLAVTTSGSYSGKVFIDGSTNAITGSFNDSGLAATNVARTTKLGGPLALEMQVNWNTLPLTIGGTVSGTNGGPWTAELTAELAAPVTASAEYTALFLPPGTPPGYGYLTITNDRGAANLIGALADGTSFSQSVLVSGMGDLPVYGNLYGSTGLLIGWIGLESGAPAGNLTWIKESSPSSALYPKGFTNLVFVQGSPWTNPLPHTAAIDLPVGQLGLSGGNLLAPLSFNVAVNNSNALVILPGSPTNSLAGSINPKTGLFTITFDNGIGKATNQGTGVVLQNATNAAGFFPGKTNAGSFLLQP